jgi:heptose-I-phosphate ethanolaminephosphotransferase
MLKHLNIFKWIGWLWAPIEKNGAFFVFMYVLGWICSVVELPLNVAKPEPYELWSVELFFDLYVLCLVLMLLPQVVRRWVRRVLYVLFYALAVVDVFCLVKFQSPITPSMLLLVGETTGKEAGEFLGNYLTWDVVFSPLGWVLLLMLLQILPALLSIGHGQPPLGFPFFLPGVFGCEADVAPIHLVFAALAFLGGLGAVFPEIVSSLRAYLAPPASAARDGANAGAL